MVCDLTGMAIANASMLDEATAAAEAMTLCQRIGKSTSTRFFVADEVLPQTLDVVRTRAAALDIEVVVGPAGACGVGGRLRRAAAVPGRERRRARLPRRGRCGPCRAAAWSSSPPTCSRSRCSRRPGEWGADAVVGTSQRFGVPMGYGGPHAGYLATRDEYKRSLPGRLVGVTVDAQGMPAYRLALQTREQHIRREKATSNICTAQVLLAVMASMYAVYHGPEGLTTIARRVHRLTAILRQGLRQLGVVVRTRAFFDTLLVDSATRQRAIVARGRGERQPAPHRRPGRSASRSTKRRRATTSRCCGGSSRGDGPRRSRRRARRGGARRAAAPSSRARRRFSRIRCSTATARKPRCCVTCARSPTATSRSTAR